MNLTRQELTDQAASLAVQGVYIGTSSWKYPGWCGTIYDRTRYEYRGKFADLSKFLDQTRRMTRLTHVESLSVQNSKSLDGQCDMDLVMTIYFTRG